MKDIGLIGCGVMGQNLALNMERNGYSVAVFDKDSEKLNNYLNKGASGKQISGYTSLKDLVNNLKIPRKVMLMVPAGKPVDECIELLIPLLQNGDIIDSMEATHISLIPTGRTKVC